MITLCFPKGNAGPPASTQVEQRTSCAQVLYCPSLEQQSSVSAKGLNADFIIQYDVDLRDPIGEVQVSSSSCLSNSHLCFQITIQECVFPIGKVHLLICLPFLRYMMDTLCIILHPEDFQWFLKMLYL